MFKKIVFRDHIITHIKLSQYDTLIHMCLTADVDIVFEPVAQWQNFSGTNFLKLFFEDPKRWTGAFTQLNSLTRWDSPLKDEQCCTAQPHVGLLSIA